MARHENLLSPLAYSSVRPKAADGKALPALAAEIGRHQFPVYQSRPGNKAHLAPARLGCSYVPEGATPTKSTSALDTKICAQCLWRVVREGLAGPVYELYEALVIAREKVRRLTLLAEEPKQATWQAYAAWKTARILDGIAPLLAQAIVASADDEIVAAAVDEAQAHLAAMCQQVAESLAAIREALPDPRGDALPLQVACTADVTEHVRDLARVLGEDTFRLARSLAETWLTARVQPAGNAPEAVGRYARTLVDRAKGINVAALGDAPMRPGLSMADAVLHAACDVADQCADDVVDALERELSAVAANADATPTVIAVCKWPPHAPSIAHLVDYTPDALAPGIWAAGDDAWPWERHPRSGPVAILTVPAQIAHAAVTTGKAILLGPAETTSMDAARRAFHLFRPDPAGGTPTPAIVQQSRAKARKQSLPPAPPAVIPAGWSAGKRHSEPIELHSVSVRRYLAARQHSEDRYEDLNRLWNETTCWVPPDDPADSIHSLEVLAALTSHPLRRDKEVFVTASRGGDDAAGLDLKQVPLAVDQCLAPDAVDTVPAYLHGVRPRDGVVLLAAPGSASTDAVPVSVSRIVAIRPAY